MRRLHLLFLLAAVLTLLLTACGDLKAANRSNPSDELALRAVLTDDDMPGFTGASTVVARPDAASAASVAFRPALLLYEHYMTNEAYSGEGRAQIDEQARAEGLDP